MGNDRANELRQQILELTRQYHAEAFPLREFTPGVSNVQVSGKVIDAEDICAVVESSLDGWFTTGRWAKEFERKLARFSACAPPRWSIPARRKPRRLSPLSPRPSSATASSSPAMKSSPSPRDFPPRSIRSFRIGLVPVFVDVVLPTYEIDVTQLEAALSPKTKAVMIAHTLGNPFDLDAVTAFCQKHNLWLVEDCCDALGSTYKGQKVGTFGDIATVSFYPAHHITMGEGGAVLTDKPALKTSSNLPRLGPRLLVRARLRQHLRQALRLAARHASLRLRPQIHLLPHRLQPQGHRHAGRGRRLADSRSSRTSSSAAKQNSST